MNDVMHAISVSLEPINPHLRLDIDDEGACTAYTYVPGEEVSTCADFTITFAQVRALLPQHDVLTLEGDIVDENDFTQALSGYEIAANDAEKNSIREQIINAVQSYDLGTAMQHMHALAVLSNVSTCNFDDLTDFSAPGDNMLVCVNGATWLAQR